MLFKQCLSSYLTLVVLLIRSCSGQHLDSVFDEEETRSVVSYPYMVAVIMDQNIERRCGGALISNKHVLTAAYCADEVKVEVILGTNDLSLGGVNYHRIAIETKDITIHPSYDRRSLANNIALLKFPESIKLNEKIAAIKLAPKDAGQFARQEGVLTTWDKGRKPRMKAANVLIISNHECRREYGRVPSEEICAEAPNRRHLGWIFADKFKANHGDPLVTLSDSTLIGIATKTKREYSHAPLLFTRISSYKEWIDKSLGEPDATSAEHAESATPLR